MMMMMVMMMMMMMMAMMMSMMVLMMMMMMMVIDVDDGDGDADCHGAGDNGDIHDDVAAAEAAGTDYDNYDHDDTDYGVEGHSWW